jgi:hypothetical protein
MRRFPSIQGVAQQLLAQYTWTLPRSELGGYLLYSHCPARLYYFVCVFQMLQECTLIAICDQRFFSFLHSPTQPTEIRHHTSLYISRHSEQNSRVTKEPFSRPETVPVTSKAHNDFLLSFVQQPLAPNQDNPSGRREF